LNSPARIRTAVFTSLLKSSRMRCVATPPITAPNSIRMIRVRLAEAAASRQRSGQLPGRSRRRLILT